MMGEKRDNAGRSCGWGRVACSGLMGALTLGGVPPAIAQAPAAEPPPSAADPPYLRPPTVCPADLETLMAGLLRDLPSYANRVANRSFDIREDLGGFSTVLLAGRAEFAPLDITPRIFSESGETSAARVHQVFFTTLERQYSETDFLNIEQYHWLFLTPAEEGWRLALMFSRLAIDESILRPPTPLRESSDGIIGQAVQLWLRDCRAGAIYPAEPLEPLTPPGAEGRAR